MSFIFGIFGGRFDGKPKFNTTLRKICENSDLKLNSRGR